jgi:virginiamycin B lyase
VNLRSCQTFASVRGGSLRSEESQRGRLITEYPIPTANAGPCCITLGRDGNLWFTEETSNQIGKITIIGVITEYPIPTGNSQAIGIIGALDGNVWFAEQNGNKIGSITRVGSITEFPLPTGGSFPQGITVGPDLNVLFTEFFGNKIAKVHVARRDRDWDNDR